MIVKVNENDKRSQIVTKISNSVFVEAGAGAGKTTLIIQRVENLLKSGVEPENIVVITFTNKATEELVSRLNERIMKLSAREDLSDEEKKNIENARRKISRMQVSTIHGFCSRLLRENALSIGLPIEQTIIDESEASYEQKLLFESFFKKQMDNGSLDALFTLYDSIYSMKRELYDLYTLFLNVGNKDVALPNADDQVPASKNYKGDAKKCFDLLCAAIKERVENNFDSGDLSNDEEYDYLLGPVKELFSELIVGNDILKNLNDLNEQLKIGKIVSSRCKLTEKEFKDSKEKKLSKTKVAEQTNAEIAGSAAAKKIDKLFKEINANKKVLLQKALRDVLLYFYDNRDNSHLTNDLLLEKTRDLLKDNESLTKELSEKFSHIFIDEFQDVDHFQAQMALLFYKAGSRLFIVGDPKQSIYRFRGAEPGIFGAVKKMFEKSQDDLVFELDNNYRTDKLVLTWINNNYASIFKDSGYRNMIEGKPKPASFVKSANTLQGVYFGPDVSKDGSDENEAGRVACMIRAIVDGDYMIVDKKWNEEKGEDEFFERRIGYDDFLVLAWNTTQFPDVVDFFRGACIPFTLSGNLTLSLYCVLERFMLIYRHLAGAGDRKLTLEGAIEGLLRSDSEDDSKRKEAMDILTDWSRETAKMNGSELAGFLLGKIHYLLPRDNEAESAISEGEMISSLGKLHQMIETISASDQTADKKDYYQSIMNYFSGKLSYEISFGETHEGSVRIMNMDKAKGLESKIVILMYRDVFKETDNDYYIETISTDSDGNELDIMDWSYRFYYKDIMTSDISSKDTTENGREMKRKQYVIVTREEEVLIVMPLSSEAKSDYLKNLSFAETSETEGTEDIAGTQAFAGATDLTDTVKDIKKYDNLLVKAVSKEFDAGKIVYSVDDELKKPSLVAFTPSGLEHEEKCSKEGKPSDENMIRLTAESSETDAPLSGAEPDNDSESEKNVQTVEKRPSGDIFGTVMHRAFELLMCYIREQDDCTAEDARTCADIAITEGIADLKERYGSSYKEKVREYQEYLEKVLTGFLNCESIKTLLSRTVQYYTEYDFSFHTSIAELGEDYEILKKYLDKKNIFIDDDQRIYVNGVVDLMLLTDDGELHIIDYKSDTKVRRKGEEYSMLSDEEFITHLKKYDGQLELYRIAMSRVFGLPKEKISTTLYDMYNGLDR